MSKIKGTLAANIVGHWDFRQGHASDISGNGNDGSFSGPVHWRNSVGGKSLVFDGDSGDVTILANAAINNIFATGGTFCAWVNPRSDGELTFGRIADKGDWTIFVNNDISGKVGLTLNHDFSGDDGNWNTVGQELFNNQWNFLCITYDGSSTANDPVFYVNSVPVAITETTAPTGTVDEDSASNITIGNLGSARTFDGAIREVILFDTALTEAQASQLYTESLQEAHLDAVPVRTVLPEQTEDSSPVMRLEMNITDGDVVADESGNGNEGDVTDVIQTEGLFGKALDFNGATSALDCGAGSTIGDIWSGGGTMSVWIYPRSDGEGSLARIVDKTAGWFAILEQESNGFCNFSFVAQWSGDDLSARTDTRGIALNAWNHVVVTYDSDTFSNRETVYINGSAVSMTASVIPTMGNSYASDTANSLFLGNNSAGSRAFDGLIENFQLFNTTLSAGQVAGLYSKALARTDLSRAQIDMEVTVANQTSGFLSNTGFEILAGTWKVDIDSEGKYIECVAAGQLAIPTLQAFGAWQFSVNWANTANSLNVMFSASEKAAPSDGSQNGYMYALRLIGSNLHLLFELSSGVETQRIGTNTGSPVVSTWYDILLTRNTDSTWGFSIDGVDVGAGDTDATHATSDYLILDMDAGDKVKAFAFRPTIPQG